MRERWILAGLAAGVATGVHPEALVLVACCGWACAVSVWRERKWVALLTPLLSVSGVVAYFSYLYDTTGDFFRWYHVQRRLWGSNFGFFHNTIGIIHRSLTDPHDLEAVVPAIGLVFTVVALVLMWRWRPPAIVWIFTCGILLSALASSLLGTRPRVLLVAFPLTVAIARATKGEIYSALVAVSGVLLGIFAFLLLTIVVVAP